MPNTSTLCCPPPASLYRNDIQFICHWCLRWDPDPAARLQVYKKTNGSIAYNRELKAQIENMRREKIMSEGILNSLQRELERVKIEMTELITTANQTFNAKEKVNNEIQNVKRQFEKEQMSYEDEWKYLTRLIEEDKKASDDKRAAGAGTHAACTLRRVPRFIDSLCIQCRRCFLACRTPAGLARIGCDTLRCYTVSFLVTFHFL